MPVPEGVDLLAAAGIPEVFLTAHDNLFTRARLRPGENVLIHGGAGGVGTAAIQLARRHGCTVLVTAGSAEKAQRCLDLGASAAINHREEDFVERGLELTGGRGVDVILDVMGASYLRRNLDALAPDGRLVIIGLQGGVSATIDLSLLHRRRLAVISTALRGRPLEQKTEIAARAVDEVWPGFADGSLQVVVDRVLSLDEASTAHLVMEAGDNVGKILLRVAT